MENLEKMIIWCFLRWIIHGNEILLYMVYIYFVLKYLLGLSGRWRSARIKNKTMLYCVRPRLVTALAYCGSFVALNASIALICESLWMKASAKLLNVII